METREEALGRAVNDTLDSIVSPALRDTLLAEALAAASLSKLPTEPNEYLEFLDGPLRQALEKALGRELGRSVREELERTSEILISEDLSSVARLIAARTKRPRSPPRLETGTSPDRRPTRSDLPNPESRRTTLPAGATPSRAPAPPSVDPPAAAAEAEAARASYSPTIPAPPEIRWSEPRPPASGDFPTGTAEALGMQIEGSEPPEARRLPMVFVATRDLELMRRFSSWLDPRAVVVRVARLMDLLLDLEDVGKRRTVIVFDYRRAPWRPEALAALAEELPDETSVLLWGATREAQMDLSRISTRVTRWIACPEATPLADVVERCVAIVG